MLYVKFAGPDAITTAITVIGWALVIGGLALIGLSLWRKSKGPEADAVIDSVVSKVNPPRPITPLTDPEVATPQNLSLC